MTFNLHVYSPQDLYSVEKIMNLCTRLYILKNISKAVKTNVSTAKNRNYTYFTK